jgi:hypothetical protein
MFFISHSLNSLFNSDICCHHSFRRCSFLFAFALFLFLFSHSIKQLLSESWQRNDSFVMTTCISSLLFAFFKGKNSTIKKSLIQRDYFHLKQPAALFFFLKKKSLVKRKKKMSTKYDCWQTTT